MRAGFTVALLACLLASCRAPWTIRPLNAEESESNSAAPFDAARYAASIWDSKVVTAAVQATDFSQARLSTRAVLVKGTGRVLRIDAARRRVLLDVAPYDGHADVELCTGRVLGTALRDALPFIQFSQFINQVDYAHAAGALNDRAAAVGATAVAGIGPGSVLSFAGALNTPMGSGLREVIPIVVTRESDRP